MKKWEYFTEELDYSQFTNDHFNNNGEDGWELVTVQIIDININNVTKKSFYAIYKKEKIEKK